MMLARNHLFRVGVRVVGCYGRMADETRIVGRELLGTRALGVDMGVGQLSYQHNYIGSFIIDRGITDKLNKCSVVGRSQFD